MNDQPAIQKALERANISSPMRSVRNLSGGCIHTVVAMTLADNTHFVAKVNDADSLRMFEEEMHSLRAIHRTGTVLAPAPILTGEFAGRAVLLMEYLDAVPDSGRTQVHWVRFGRELAALHAADAGTQYGFDQDNHIGSTPQPNSWHRDWVEFNAVNRLGFQIALASDNALIERNETRLLEAVTQHLDQFLPRKPRPSLLHGDLWSGNVLKSQDDAGNPRIAVIDPASSIGDGWADIAMMRLFGRFPTACFEAYQQVIAPPADLESRLAVYTLYHVLNHVNIFGRGYVDQAVLIANRLDRLVR